MSYFWTEFENEARLILWKMCLSSVMPLSAHVYKISGFLLTVLSVLCQIQMYLDGVRGVFVIRWNFHQAVRAAAIVGVL